jgi:hypothetical protein
MDREIQRLDGLKLLLKEKTKSLENSNIGWQNKCNGGVIGWVITIVG